MKKKTDRIALFLFYLSAVFLVFGYGVVVGKYRIFPYRVLAYAEVVFDATMTVLVSEQRPHHLFPAWYEYSGARVRDARAMAKGVTLLTSYWRPLDWKPGIQLIDSTGQVLHQWKTDPADIWPTSPHMDLFRGMKNTSNNYIHGCFLFNNGDVLFNIEYLGLVRMNARGEVLWKLPYRTHHSVTRDPVGHFWVCGLKWIEDTPEERAKLAQYPGLNPPVAEEFALKVSAEGEILQEISILKALYRSGYQQLIRQISGIHSGDILHTNDVEPLRSDMAGQYPHFKAGDIAVSCRNINTILVIDTETEEIKWLLSRFRLQHDPDFLKDGWIYIFNNNTYGFDHLPKLRRILDNREGKLLPSWVSQYPGGSQIVAVKPGEDLTRVIYPRTDKQSFYTPYGGKVQCLENGNLLITEAQRGRVFEIDVSGRTVWEWVHERYDSEVIPEVLEGTRYNLTREQIAAWKSK